MSAETNLWFTCRLEISNGGGASSVQEKLQLPIVLCDHFLFKIHIPFICASVYVDVFVCSVCTCDLSFNVLNNSWPLNSGLPQDRYRQMGICK